MLSLGRYWVPRLSLPPSPTTPTPSKTLPSFLSVRQSTSANPPRRIHTGELCMCSHVKFLHIFFDKYTDQSTLYLLSRPSHSHICIGDSHVPHRRLAPSFPNPSSCHNHGRMVSGWSISQCHPDLQSPYIKNQRFVAFSEKVLSQNFSSIQFKHTESTDWAGAGITFSVAEVKIMYAIRYNKRLTSIVSDRNKSTVKKFLEGQRKIGLWNVQIHWQRKSSKRSNLKSTTGQYL